MRSIRAFTMIELAIVISIAVLLLPSIYLFWRSEERALFEAVAKIEAADAARSISEELRRDLATMHWAGENGMLLAGGSCTEVRYEVVGAVAFRRAPASCGGDRAIARHVEHLRRTPWGGVEMVFARHTRASEPFRTTVLFAGGEQP